MEKTLERSGTRIAYSIVGDGPPLVLGHSLFCDRSMWDGVLAELSGFTVINVALRGHNESTAEAPFSVWDLADDWVAILDVESIDRAALVGLSTGGMTAMRLAARYPERVCGLAIIDSDADAEASRWKRFEQAALGGLYRRTGIIPVGALTRAMFGPSSLKAKRPYVAALVELMRSHDRRQLGHAMKAIFGRDAVDVSKVSVPTLVVAGEHDAATPPGRSRKIADIIEGARLEIIEDAGHLSAIEKPAELAALLNEFLPSCFD